MMNLVIGLVLVGFLMVVVMYGLLDDIFGITKKIDEVSYKRFCEKNGYKYLTKEERREKGKKEWRMALGLDR